MASYDTDAHDTDAFDTDAFFLLSSGHFPGTVASDGGHIWPPRASDPRWTQIISDSGITPTGNFQDDVRSALVAINGIKGQLDDLWKKFKLAEGVTDVSEPFTY
jgi:hypothetical protein